MGYITSGFTIIKSIFMLIILAQIVIHIPKLYRLIAYKIAVEASEKYLDSRLLVGIKGKDVTKIASQLDGYLNNVLRIDLNEAELICIVESKIYRTINNNKQTQLSNKTIESINDSLNSINDTIGDKDLKINIENYGEETPEVILEENNRRD